MTKRQITRTWIGGLVAIAAGLLAAMVGVALMLGIGGTWSGPHDHVTFTPHYDSVFWGMVATAAAGGLLFIAGAVAQFVAWILAMVVTFRLETKTWFLLLLVLGLIGFQFPVMIAYLVAGPDQGTPATHWAPPPAPMPPPPPPAFRPQSV
jgi:hypothetical protein